MSMKLYAPKYYKRFRCIADRCEHSCCIGWEIDVDAETLEKYKRLKDGYGTVIADSISMEDTPHFRLADHDRCPHLNGQGLCNIILQVGEDYLCDICREHPRFYNYTAVAEVGLGMSCAEAARLILDSPDYGEMEELGQVDAVADDVAFDGRAGRDELYAALRDPSREYEETLARISRGYSIRVGEDARWREVLGSLEYLNADHKALFLQYSAALRPRGMEDYLKRFLAYLIYRHCTEAFDEEDFAVRLAFCLFCERLLASMICAEGAASLREVAALASMLSEEIEYSDENTAALMDEVAALT